MWIYRTGTIKKPIILYDYQKRDLVLVLGNFLKGFSGFLQTDGYQGVQ